MMPSASTAGHPGGKMLYHLPPMLATCGSSKAPASAGGGSQRCPAARYFAWNQYATSSGTCGTAWNTQRDKTTLASTAQAASIQRQSLVQIASLVGPRSAVSA